MASKYVQPELQAALDAFAADQERVRNLRNQLSTAKADYQTALQNYDAEAAAAVLPRVQVLEALHQQAIDAIRHIQLSAVRVSVDLARQDVREAQERLKNLAQAVSPDAFADRTVREASRRSFDLVPSYARSAAEALSAWHLEISRALGELGQAERLLTDAVNGRGDLDAIGTYLQQTEVAVQQAGDVASKADSIRQAIAQANSQYLEGVAS